MVGFHLYEVHRVVKFIEIESRMVIASVSGEGEMGSCFLTGTEFQLGMT